MFTLSKPTLTAIVLAASVAVGYAQNPVGGRGPGMMMGGGAGMMGHYWNTESYLGSLKSELGITASQEPAWKDYADTVSGVRAQMQGLHQTMFEAMNTASWQERRDMMNRMFEARQQAYDTVHAAAVKLMSALDPSQQTKARRELPGLAFGRHMMMGG